MMMLHMLQLVGGIKFGVMDIIVDLVDLCVLSRLNRRADYLFSKSQCVCDFLHLWFGCYVIL